MPATRTHPTVARRPRLPRPERPPASAPEGRLPPDAAAPGYSPDTLALINALSPLERGVVELRAANYSAAESYRLARGTDSPNAKQSAYQIFRRPRVAAALDAVLRDRGSHARADRGWALRQLKRIVEEAAEMRTPAFGKTLINAIDLMCRLQGELPLGRPGRRRSTPLAPPRPSANSDGLERIKAILADADREAAERGAALKAQVPTAVVAGPMGPLPAASPTSNPRLDKLIAEAAAPAARPGPRPAVEGPPVVAPPAAPTPADAPPRLIKWVISDDPSPRPAEPPPPEDGLPIGVLRPFGGEIRIPRTEIVVPQQWDVDEAGPVLPRVSNCSIRYRGTSPYFMGIWQ